MLQSSSEQLDSVSIWFFFTLADSHPYRLRFGNGDGDEFDKDGFDIDGICEHTDSCSRIDSAVCCDGQI